MQIVLTVGLMILILSGFYAMRQRQLQDPVLAAAAAYRRKVGGPFGMLPPRMEPVGLALTALTVASVVGALALLFSESRWLIFACGVMIVSSTLSARRDKQWLDSNAEYQALLQGD